MNTNGSSVKRRVLRRFRPRRVHVAASGEHYNPLLVSVLPPERRARHPHQLAAMGLLLIIGAWQLIEGPAAVAAINTVDQGTQNMLNWFCIVGGLGGIVAAIVPERVVRWWFIDFDATYARLWEELATHNIAAGIWISYLALGLSVSGVTVLTVAGLLFAGASIWRCCQILADLIGAGVFTRRPSVIVSGDQPDSDGER